MSKLKKLKKLDNLLNDTKIFLHNITATYSIITNNYDQWVDIKNTNDDIILFEPKMQQEWVYDFEAFNKYINSLSPSKQELRLANPGKLIILNRINNYVGYVKGNLYWSATELTMFNSNLIKQIRWDYEVNKLSHFQIQLKYDLTKLVESNITNYKTWININIDKEITEYQQSKTINGLTEQQIIAKGGI